MKRITFTVIILMISFQLLSAEKKRNILDEVSDNYMAIVPFQLEFRLVQEYDNGNNVQETMGEFYLHNKECFRVNYPDQQILFDGSWLWSIDKLNKQIVVEAFDPSSSLRLIYNVLNGNMSEYKIVDIVNCKNEEEKGMFRVNLKSINDNSFFESMIVWIVKGKNEINKVEYTDFQKNNISIYFNKFYKYSIPEEELFQVKNITADELIDLRE